MAGRALIPQVWRLLSSAWWGLSERDMRDCWFALTRSRYARPTKLRAHFALVGRVRIDLGHFALEVMRPEFVFAVLEDLTHEGKLRRKQASRIETKLLALVDVSGAWKE